MMGDLAPCGGFQSGFDAQIILREYAKYPEFLICKHNCGEVIQLVSRVSGEPEFELCREEAIKMAMTLLEAAGIKSVVVWTNGKTFRKYVGQDNSKYIVHTAKDKGFDKYRALLIPMKGAFR